ncbi:MAG: hypothetical protein ABF743_13730 [Schleiferilactobacillus perolens]|jgi:hypothetical protein
MMQKLLKQFLWWSLLIVGLTVTSAVDVAAANGNLEIDSTPIYQDQTQREQNSAYTFVPDLFLPTRNQVDQKNLEAHEILPKQAIKQVFGTQKKAPTKEQLVSVSKLFDKRWQIGSLRGENSAPTPTSHVEPLFWPVIILLGILLTLLGIYLGRRFSAIIKEKGETS